MNRPPSRTGASGQSRPKLQAVPTPKPKKAQKAPNPRRSNTRLQEQRLKAHVRGAKQGVSRLRPAMSLTKKLTITVGAGLSALVALILVAVFSPLLAVKKIEIVGAVRVSEKELAKDLEFLKGIPLPQISNDAIVEKLSKYQLVDSVSAVSLPPSTVRIVVVERTAIAKVQVNGIDYLYDAVGVQLGRATSSDKLPTISNAGNPKTSGTFKQAIAVLLSLPASLLPKVASIQALSKDNVTLYLRSSSQRVLWGDDSERALKAKVLTALMANYHGKYGVIFDVSSPNNPTIR